MVRQSTTSGLNMFRRILASLHRLLHRLVILVLKPTGLLPSSASLCRVLGTLCRVLGFQNNEMNEGTYELRGTKNYKKLKGPQRLLSHTYMLFIYTYHVYYLFINLYIL